MEKHRYQILANVFRYPMEGYLNNLKECRDLLYVYYPEAALVFDEFYLSLKDKSVEEIEEVFALTFHIQAICFLDLGYVIFGEDYKRGEFLVNMKREQAIAFNDCGEELADHLPNVLTLMAIKGHTDFTEELACIALIPALEKMLDEFRTSRIVLKNKIMLKKQKALLREDLRTDASKKGNIYQYALEALKMVLESDFNINIHPKVKIEPNLGNFAVGCSTCSTTPQQIKK